MISTRTINVLATPVIVKILAMGGRLDGVAAYAGGITRIQTAITVIRWIYNNYHNLTNMYI